MTAAVYVGRHRKPDPEETIQIPPVVWSQEEPQDLQPVAWPTEDDMTHGQFVGELSVPKPAGLVHRFLRRLALVRWSGTRVTAAASSGVTLAGSGALWLVIR